MSFRYNRPYPCGSSKEGFPLVDARGIFCATVCDKCEAEKRARYRPEIFSDGAYDCDEPVEEDY